MIQYLKTQSPFYRDRGGIQLLLDGYEGWRPYYGDDVKLGDILSTLTLILLCCMALSCFFSSSNILSTSVVISDDSNEDLLPGRYRHGLRLLNRDEVLSLPEVEFGLERVLVSEENETCGGSNMTNEMKKCSCNSGDISLVSINESDQDSISLPDTPTIPISRPKNSVTFKPYIGIRNPWSFQKALFGICFRLSHSTS